MTVVNVHQAKTSLSRLLAQWVFYWNVVNRCS